MVSEGAGFLCDSVWLVYRDVDRAVSAGAVPEYPVEAYPHAAAEAGAAGYALSHDGSAGYDKPLWNAPDARVLGGLLPAVLLLCGGVYPRIWSNVT